MSLHSKKHHSFTHQKNTSHTNIVPLSKALLLSHKKHFRCPKHYFLYPKKPQKTSKTPKNTKNTIFHRTPKRPKNTHFHGGTCYIMLQHVVTCCYTTQKLYRYLYRHQKNFYSLKKNFYSLKKNFIVTTKKITKKTSIQSDTTKTQKK